MPYDTLEAAQARIIELDEANAALTAERDTLSQNINEMTAAMETLRKMNQDYFNRLIQQKEHHDEPGKEDIPPTCEEFAKTLTI